MIPIIPTIYGAALQTSLLQGRPFNIPPYTTLNEKHNVVADLTLNTNDIPREKYFGIGNGGAQIKSSSVNFVKIDPGIHSVTDGAFFNQIPFIARSVNSDLSATERMNYRLRVIKNINGNDYAFYYLKLLSVPQSTPDLVIKNTTNGVTTTEQFITNSSNLNPTPISTNIGEVQVTNGKFAAVNADVTINMTTNDMAELSAACALLYNDSASAVIYEIAIISGVDRVINGLFAGAQAPYTEVVCSQVTAFMPANMDADMYKSGFTFVYSTGATEAMPIYS